MATESREQVLQHFMELGEDDRRTLLERIAGDEDGDPVDMFVSANMVMSSDDFREAKYRLVLRGYGTDFVGI